MSIEDNKKLSVDAAEALLSAIHAAAPTANNSGTDGLKSLAEAYTLVVGAMPKKEAGERRGSVGM